MLFSRPLVTCFAAAGCSLAAQSFTSPSSGFPGTGSPTTTVQPFSTTTGSARYQYVLGDVRHGAARTVSSITLRADEAAVSSAGRSVSLWLRVGDATTTDYFALSTTNPDSNLTNAVDAIGTSATPGTVNLPATTAGTPIPLPFDASSSFVYGGAAGLVLDFRVTSTSSADYSLDCADGSLIPSVGAFSYIGRGSGCTVPPSMARFTVIRTDGPALSLGNTICGQYATAGPVSSAGVLSLGLTDPNTTFGGALCGPLRSLPDITLPVTTSATGGIGSGNAPLLFSFPSATAAFSFYTQFVVLDANRQPPALQVALSDTIRWDITPPLGPFERYRVSGTSSFAKSFLFVPAVQFN